MLDAAKFTPTLSAAVAHPPPRCRRGLGGSKEFALTTHTRSVQLDKHVGHQVEVTGTLAEATAMGTGAPWGRRRRPGRPGRLARSPLLSGTTGTPTLDVNSVRMIAKSCR